MNLTGKPCPEFHVKVLRRGRRKGAPERVAFSTLSAGVPTVIHFYNAG